MVEEAYRDGFADGWVKGVAYAIREVKSEFQDFPDYEALNERICRIIDDILSQYASMNNPD